MTKKIRVIRIIGNYILFLIRKIKKTAFPYIWILFGILSILLGVLTLIGICSSSNCFWIITKCLIYAVVISISLLFVAHPMNAVYGLMGTSGSIRLFFSNFLFITFLFACIYQWAFFSKAGISYDVNQAHIDYNLYDTSNKGPIKVTHNDTISYKKLIDSHWVRETIIQESEYNYQPIPFVETWCNTIMTTLMQEPTDFFAAATTYNSAMDEDGPVSNNKESYSLDRQKSLAFHWLLNIQILISWIFFGVFISLLYNKFRHES